MQRLGIAPVALAIVVAAGSLQAADTVSFTNESGRPENASGNIREETEREVVIQTSTGQKRIPVFQINEVRYDGQPAELVNVRSKFNQGRFDEVVEDLNNIGRSVGGDNAALAQALAYGVFAAQAEMAVLDAEKADDALEWYSKFGDAMTNTRHYYPMQEYLGRVYLAKGDFAKADQAFQTLEELDWPGYKEKAIVYRGQAALKQDNHQEAADLFERVVQARGDSPQLQEQQLLAKVYHAKALVGMGQAQEAADILKDTLQEIPSSETTIKAIGHNTLGDALRALEKNPKEVMLEGYMWVFVVYNKNPEERAYAIYNLVDIFRQLQQNERAQQMVQLLQSDHPKSPWTQKLTGG